jgi:hypothetical protein
LLSVKNKSVPFSAFIRRARTNADRPVYERRGDVSGRASAESPGAIPWMQAVRTQGRVSAVANGSPAIVHLALHGSDCAVVTMA